MSTKQTTPQHPGDGTSEPRAVDHGGSHGVFFYACLVIGWAIIIFGLHGMVSNSGQANPPALFRLLITLNIVNDALLVPLVIVVSVLVRRLLPSWLLMPVQTGLIATAVVTMYAYPLLGDWGRTRRAGFSRLPWDYAHNLGVVLAVIWLVCVLLAAWSWRRTPSPRR